MNRKGFCTVNDVAMMTGLNPRTIREYLRRGLLQGEKTASGWRFTGEQFGALISHPEVARSLWAKDQGMVLDFLDKKKKEVPAACVILDLPTEDGQEEILLNKLLALSREGVNFRYRREGTMARITAAGPPARLSAILEEMGPNSCNGKDICV